MLTPRGDSGDEAGFSCPTPYGDSGDEAGFLASGPQRGTDVFRFCPGAQKRPASCHHRSSGRP